VAEGPEQEAGGSDPFSFSGRDQVDIIRHFEFQRFGAKLFPLIINMIKDDALAMPHGFSYSKILMDVDDRIVREPLIG
jgi:hypothetical protein